MEVLTRALKPALHLEALTAPFDFAQGRLEVVPIDGRKDTGFSRCGMKRETRVNTCSIGICRLEAAASRG